MTEKEYRERRAELVSQAMRINGRFFPRCLTARLRMIAQLDAAHTGSSDIAARLKSLREDFGAAGTEKERRLR